MTFRQKEFCRLFAQGMPAPNAALAAGYAKATAERNVVEILQSPDVEAYLNHRRAGMAHFCPDDIAQTRRRLLDLQGGENGRLALAAVREMRLLLTAFPTLIKDPSENACNKISPQPTDNELLTENMSLPENAPNPAPDPASITIPEHDDTPTSPGALALLQTLQDHYLKNEPELDLTLPTPPVPIDLPPLLPEEEELEALEKENKRLQHLAKTNSPDYDAPAAAWDARMDRFDQAYP